MIDWLILSDPALRYAAWLLLTVALLAGVLAGHRLLDEVAAWRYRRTIRRRLREYVG